MTDFEKQVRQFKHVIGEGRLVAMASLTEIGDDGYGPHSLRLELAFDDQALNPPGTAGWIVNTTQVSADDSWQEIDEGAADAAEELYTFLLGFHFGKQTRGSAGPNPGE